MNNSYSGNHSPSNLSGNYSRTSSPISKSKKLPRDIDVYGYLEDPAMTLLRETMLRATSFDSVETSELEKLYWHLRDYSYYCGIKSNYDEALETEKLLEYTHLELKERGIKPKSKITSEIMGPAFYQNLQTKWMNQLLTFDEETERKKESIEGRHVSEIRYLESKWKSYRLRPYSKVTPMLRDMINHEDISKATGNIEMAKYLNEKIAQKRKKEVSEQQFIADSEYKMNLDLLLKKQAKELDNYIDTRAHKRELIVIKQQKELMAAECKTSVVLDWYHKKPKEPLVPVPLPTRGLVKPHIHQKQKKGGKLLPPIRPPPLKDSEWNPESPSKTKNFVIKCMPKGHHILSGFNKEEEKAFNPQGAMELLKRRFAKFTQPKEEKEQPNKRKRRRKKDDDDDEVFNYNEFYQSMRNPANLSMKRKKKANTNKKATPLFLPVIYRMDSKSIMNRMRNIEEKEKNKSNASRSSKSRRKGLNSDHEYDYDEEEFNDQNDEYKQKVAVSATLNDVYDRIVKCEAVNRIKLSRSGSRYSKSRSKRSFTSSKSSFARTNQRMRNNARGKFDRKKMMESIRANKDEIQLYLLAQQNVVQQLDSESSSEYYPEEEENLNSDNERSPRSSRIKSTRHSVRKSTRSHKTARDENGEYYYNYSDYSYNYDYEDYSDEENDKTHKGKKMKKHKYYRRRRNSNDEYSDYSYYSYYSEYTDEENEGKETHIQENIPESIQENIQNLVNTENEVVETEEEEVNEAHVSINDIAIEEEEEIYENIVDDQGNLIKVLSSRSNVKSSRSTQNTTNEGIVEEAKRKRKKRRHTKYINFSDTLDNRVNNENINNDESMYYSSEYYDSKKEEEEIVDFQDNDANGENLNNKFSKTAKKNDYNIDDSLNEIVQNKINKLANTVNIRSKHADKISLVDQDTQKPSYIPKLAISSIIPHDTLPKKNKHRIPIPQMPNTQPKPIVSHSMKYKNNGTSYRNMIQKRYPIDKLSASTRLTSRLLNQTDNPYENGLYSGTVVKTISSGVLPVKH